MLARFPLPEVDGDKARYFGPHDIQDVGRSLIELLGNREPAREPVANGRKRRATFTRERIARGTLESSARARREGREDNAGPCAGAKEALSYPPERWHVNVDIEGCERTILCVRA
jgi:hypothetical protein